MSSEWSGVGPPPTRGTKCEVQPWHEHDSPWIEVEFIASWLAPNGQTYSWVHTGYGWLEPKMFRFRPIRTPEQIAAEERLKAIDEMAAVYKSNYEGHVKDGCQALYDAGYRKQEAP